MSAGSRLGRRPDERLAPNKLWGNTFFLGTFLCPLLLGLGVARDDISSALLVGRAATVYVALWPAAGGGSRQAVQYLSLYSIVTSRTR
jgi:hypothetical protein